MMLRLTLCFLVWSFVELVPANGDEGNFASSPRSVQPILIGAEVPEMILKDIHGAVVDLGATLQANPTVLVFYRGHW